MYRCHTKPQLEALCRKSDIPVVSSLPKHQLVSFLVEKNGEEPPVLSTNGQEYSGDLSTIPGTTTAITCLTIPYLKSVFSFHNVSTIGSKEQLVLRTYLLRTNRTADVVSREEEQLKDLIDI